MLLLPIHILIIHSFPIMPITFLSYLCRLFLISLLYKPYFLRDMKLAMFKIYTPTSYSPM
ncbi:hypothetical protein CW304_30895 [Bacillus sp. UFRGS-B20]|nr:hypothetical protein CW304_30895 [Bacillus sp. UFRGS-B20]